MDELISVVIPVYNVEKYLHKCIESILKQTYSNLEIILVDDGSTDSSGKKCDELAQRDNRIKVFHKKNGGLSDARNYGLRKITGDWVTFIDSDDYVCDRYIELLYRALKEEAADISICNPVHVFKDEEAKFVDATKVESFDAIKAIQKMWYQKDFLPSAWGKLYSSKIFENIEFTKGVIYEDIDIMHEIFIKARKIVYTNAAYYAYLHRENSITTQKFSKKDLYILDICKKIRKFSNDVDARLINASKAYSIVGSMRVYLNTPRDVEEYKVYITDAENYIKAKGIEVLRDKNVRKKTKIGVLLFYISKRGMKVIHSKVNRWK